MSALCLILSGRIEITDEGGDLLSILGPRNSFGERGLLRDGIAPVTATATEDSEVLAIPAPVFKALVAAQPRVLKFFDRTRPTAARRQDITTMALSDLMTRDPLTCAPDTPLIEAARKMRDLHVSCIIATVDGTAKGILTTGDITGRAVAEGRPTRHPRLRRYDPRPYGASAHCPCGRRVACHGRTRHHPYAGGRGRPACRHPDTDRPHPVSGHVLRRADPRDRGRPRQRDAGPDRGPHPRTAGATGWRAEPAPDRHPPDHRHL